MCEIILYYRTPTSSSTRAARKGAKVPDQINVSKDRRDPGPVQVSASDLHNSHLLMHIGMVQVEKSHILKCVTATVLPCMYGKMNEWIWANLKGWPEIIVFLERSYRLV